MLSRPSLTWIDAVINHPSVRSAIEQGTHRLTAESLLASGARVFGEQGAVIVLVPLGQGVYQGHVAAIDGSRGAVALQLGASVLRTVFNAGEAVKVVAEVPLQLPAARLYCRRLKFSSIGQDLFQEYFEVEAAQWAD